MMSDKAWKDPWYQGRTWKEHVKTRLRKIQVAKTGKKHVKTGLRNIHDVKIRLRRIHVAKTGLG